MIQVRDPITKQITREVIDNCSKGQLFYETFFPPLNPDLETVPQDFRYPPTRWTFKNITDDQIHRAIKRMKPFKVSKKGLVPNSVLIHAREELIPFLGPLFCATNMLSYYPQEWACMETLILKKPGKLDYTIAATW
jgi:hypothetical protein